MCNYLKGRCSTNKIPRTTYLIIWFWYCPAHSPMYHHHKCRRWSTASWFWVSLTKSIYNVCYLCGLFCHMNMLLLFVCLLYWYYEWCFDDTSQSQNYVPYSLVFTRLSMYTISTNCLIHLYYGMLYINYTSPRRIHNIAIYELYSK